MAKVVIMLVSGTIALTGFTLIVCYTINHMLRFPAPTRSQLIAGAATFIGIGTVAYFMYAPLWLAATVGFLATLLAMLAAGVRAYQRRQE